MLNFNFNIIEIGSKPTYNVNTNTNTLHPGAPQLQDQKFKALKKIMSVFYFYL